MGYFVRYGASRDSVIQDILASEPGEDGKKREALRHCLVGNVLWSVWEITAEDGSKSRLIRCDLLARDKDGWGNKSLTESSHPFYYSCPLAYLEEVPERCPEWRRKVRAYWAERNKRAREHHEAQAEAGGVAHG